jgi:hypothetical protein
MSTKKLNEALGIDNIDSMLEDMNIDDDVQQLKDIDAQMDQNVEKIDTQMANFTEGGIQKVDITDISTSLNEIKDLINVSKDTIRHVYEQITSVELVDSEAVQALGKLIEATHLTISEYINLFKDRLAFYDKVRFEAIKHKNDMEKIKYKHDLDMEKLNAKQGPAVEVTNNNVNAFSQEDVIKMIDKT